MEYRLLRIYDIYNVPIPNNDNLVKIILSISSIHFFNMCEVVK